MKREVRKENPADAPDEDKNAGSMNINIGVNYQFDPENFQIDVTNVSYANYSYIQVTGSDVFIDFLQMPGVKKEGKMAANATRIYLTHANAKKLSLALAQVLEKSYKAGKMETYQES